MSYNTAYECLKQAATRQKNTYDKGLKVRQYQVNDKVWRGYPPPAKLKLGLGWTGPYIVSEKVTDVTYKIENCSNKRQLVAHVDHLKPYSDRHDTPFADAPAANGDDSDIGTAYDPNISLDVHAEPDFQDNLDTDSDPDVEPDASVPKTPYVKRTGRQVKPKERYSPG